MESLNHAVRLPAHVTLEDGPLPENYRPPKFAHGLVNEWRHEAKLIAGGSAPTQSALLIGPSGVGKTTAARWVARELRRPCITYSLAAGIDGHLGETGQLIDLAFDAAIKNGMFLVVDEIDAIGATRTGAVDSCAIEDNRITSALIQLLDKWHSVNRSAMLVATTNLVKNIDVAIRRRFEVELSVPLPTLQDLVDIAGCQLPACAVGLTQADLARLMKTTRRESILHGGVWGDRLRAAIEARSA